MRTNTWSQEVNRNSRKTERTSSHGAPGAGLLAQPIEHRGKPPPLLGVVGVQQQLVAAAAYRHPEQLLEGTQIGIVGAA